MKNKFLVFNFLLLLIASTTVLAQDDRETITRALVKNLASKDFEAVQSNFAPTLKEQLSPQLIGQVWNSLITNIGEYESIVSITEQEVQGYKVSVAKSKFSKGNASVEVAFDEKNEIAGLFIKP